MSVEQGHGEALHPAVRIHRLDQPGDLQTFKKIRSFNIVLFLGLKQISIFYCGHVMGAKALLWQKVFQISVLRPDRQQGGLGRLFMGQELAGIHHKAVIDPERIAIGIHGQTQLGRGDLGGGGDKPERLISADTPQERDRNSIDAGHPGVSQQHL